jgi:hypothetical protein
MTIPMSSISAGGCTNEVAAIPWQGRRNRGTICMIGPGRFDLVDRYLVMHEGED